MDYRPDIIRTAARLTGSLTLAARAEEEPRAPRAAPFARERRRPPARPDAERPATRAEARREPRRDGRRRRRSIGEINAIVATPVALPAPVPAPVPGRDPSRWARFEAQVVAAGVPRERLLAAFPTAEDVEDIFHTPDADIDACAASVARALGGRAEAVEPTVRTTTVRCADCAHFARSATHPRLGRCGAGEPATAAGGWWDTQPRRCEAFVGNRDDTPRA